MHIQNLNYLQNVKKSRDLMDVKLSVNSVSMTSVVSGKTHLSDDRRRTDDNGGNQFSIGAGAD